MKVKVISYKITRKKRRSIIKKIQHQLIKILIVNIIALIEQSVILIE